MSSFKLWVACLPWFRLPPLLWFLIASPVLHWAGICHPSGRWFNWPEGK